MSDRPEPATARLNERTTVPLTWVVGIVVFLLTAFGTLLSSYAWLDNQFDTVTERLISVEAKLDQVGSDRWTRSDMATWSATLLAANPTITLPTMPTPHSSE